MSGASIRRIALSSAVVLVTAFSAFSVSGSPSRGLEEGLDLKLYHLVLGAVLLTLGLRGLKRIRFGRRSVALPLMLLLNMAIVTAVVSIVSAPPPASAKLVGVAGAWLAGMLIAGRLTPDELLSAIRLAAVLAITVIAVKALLYLPELQAQATRAGWKPDIPLFVAGGVNIEASTLVLLSCAFLRHRYFLPLWGMASAISYLYLSRTSMAGAALVLAVYILQRGGRHATRRRLVGAGVSGFVAFWLLTSGDSFVLERLASVGSDQSSLQRLSFWGAGLDAVMHNPLGSGAGAGAASVEGILETDLRAGNLHNIYVQVMVDTGLQGLALFALVIAQFRRVAGRLSHSELPVLQMLGVFLVMGLFQFTPYESLPWLLFGFVCGLPRRTDGPDSGSEDRSPLEDEDRHDPYRVKPARTRQVAK